MFQSLENFRILSALLKPVGCRIGIEHVGHQVAHIGELHDLGLDYLKIDASFVQNIDQNQANQVFLRGLAIIAHSTGIALRRSMRVFVFVRLPNGSARYT